MDRKTAIALVENIEMVKAYAQGKTIQMRYYSDGTDYWRDKLEPLFTGNPENYRIKPEPVELEVWYHESAGTVYAVKRIGECDEYMVRQGFRRVKLREVFPD